MGRAVSAACWQGSCVSVSLMIQLPKVGRLWALAECGALTAPKTEGSLHLTSASVGLSDPRSPHPHCRTAGQHLPPEGHFLGLC